MATRQTVNRVDLRSQRCVMAETHCVEMFAIFGKDKALGVANHSLGFDFKRIVEKR